MQNERVPAQFDKAMIGECTLNCTQLPVQQAFQIVVGDIAG